MTLNQYNNYNSRGVGTKPTQEENLQSSLGTWYEEIGDLEIEDLTEYDLGNLIEQRMSVSLILPEVVKRLNNDNPDSYYLLEFILNNISAITDLESSCVKYFMDGLERYYNQLSDPSWKEVRDQIQSILSAQKST